MNAALIDVAAACQTLSIGRTKIYELIGDGQLELVKIGRRTLVTVTSVEQFIEESRVPRCSRSKRKNADTM